MSHSPQGCSSEDITPCHVHHKGILLLDEIHAELYLQAATCKPADSNLRGGDKQYRDSSTTQHGQV